MKVKCINNTDNPRLTVGKVYEATQSPSSEHYRIVNDAQQIVSVFKDRFVEYVEPKFVDEPNRINEKLDFIACDFATKEKYVAKLNTHTFVIKTTCSFNIETAVDLRDWLNEMIEIAKESGYFDVKEMTIEEIQNKLGYKIKIVEGRNPPCFNLRREC